MRSIGKGHAAANMLNGHLGLPPPIRSGPWARHTEHIQAKVADIRESQLEEAAMELKRLKILNGEVDGIPSGTEPSPTLVKDTIVDVAVTFDGSWKNRGLKSHHCFVSAISVDTGRVIDYTYVTNQCKICNDNADLDKSGLDYLEFMVEHGPDCRKNHEGSSQSMEAAGVLQLYERSIEKFNLRYSTLIGDGDSSAYSRVCKEMPYGPDRIVEKEECVGHVMKRMGTRLQKLVGRLKGQKLEDGKGLQGRGRLTLTHIDAFQRWYGKCLKDNKGNPEAARRGTLAMLHHYAEDASHDYCPPGPDSWCKYQVDLSLGTNTHQPCQWALSPAIVGAIMPIFRDLSDIGLLSSCSRAMTQNQNESLHHVIWSLAPKEQYNSTTEVELAIDLAVLYFNIGRAAANREIFGRLELPLAPHAMAVFQSVDKDRVYHAQRQKTPAFSARRIEIRYGGKNKALAFVKGKADYKSGTFHSKSRKRTSEHLD